VGEFDAHVEHAADPAVELVALHDGAVLVHEQSGHRVHDARGVLSGQHQDAVVLVGGSRHGTSIVGHFRQWRGLHT
jgi:rhodanese-related sulfurtransferase